MSCNLLSHPDARLRQQVFPSHTSTATLYLYGDQRSRLWTIRRRCRFATWTSHPVRMNFEKTLLFVRP